MGTNYSWDSHGYKLKLGFPWVQTEVGIQIHVGTKYSLDSHGYKLCIAISRFVLLLLISPG